MSRSTKAREIGARIEQARHEAGGMTQAELASLVGVAVQANGGSRSVQAWEAGDYIPYRYLKQLESALGKPAAWFLHGEDAIVDHDVATKEILDRLDKLQRAVNAMAKRLPK